MTILFADTRRALLRLALILTLLPLAGITWAGGDHGHDDDNHGHEEEQRTHVQMSAAMAEKSGITTAVAAGGELTETRLLYGRIVTDPRQVSVVRARFPGQIARMPRTLGDTVKAGDVVAEVEANESLRRYSVTAPISGTVVAVNANAGELTGDAPLLTIANHDRLWAEFRLYGGDQNDVSKGQHLQIRADGKMLDSRIEQLLPASNGEPFTRALAPVPNPAGEWMPGQWVEGDLAIQSEQVPLLVDNRALQSVRDGIVVFIQVGDEYEIRPLELGRSNGRVTAVLSGLNAGDRYVVGNSYLLKADLEKSGAAHDH